MVKKFNWNTYLKKNSLPIILQIVGLVVVVANLYLASQLSPLAKNIDSLNIRVSAVEIKQDKCDDNIINIAVIKNDIETIKENLNCVKSKIELLVDR